MKQLYLHGFHHLILTVNIQSVGFIELIQFMAQTVYL